MLSGQSVTFSCEREREKNKKWYLLLYSLIVVFLFVRVSTGAVERIAWNQPQVAETDSAYVNPARAAVSHVPASAAVLVGVVMMVC